MPMWIFVFVLVAVGLVAFAVVMLTGANKPAPLPGAHTPPRLPDPRLAEAEEFIEHLRELAWDHRDIAPELSTIIIDEIRQRHRNQPDRPEG
jgi:hypothetical protein